MKKITVLLVLMLLILGSTTALAYEVVGGGIYTTFDLGDVNDKIEEANEDFSSMASGSDFDLSKFDKIESTFGYYLGGYVDLPSVSPKLKVGGRYEDISPAETEASIKYDDGTNTGSMDISFDVTLKGLVGTAKYQFNEFLTVDGGLGYYMGKIESKEEYAGVLASGETDSSDESDLSGLGIKLGVGTDYPVAENTAFYGELNYRLLNLDVDDNPDFDEINASGIEAAVGVVYKF